MKREASCGGGRGGRMGIDGDIFLGIRGRYSDDGFLRIFGWELRFLILGGGDGWDMAWEVGMSHFATSLGAC